jgi:epoxyqueuosine reductase QueG
MSRTNLESGKRLAEELERFALEGVDKFGIASAEAFEGAPAGERPTDLMPGCKSVIAFAVKHLEVFATSENLDCQAYSQDITNRETLHQAYRISRFLEKHGYLAFPMVASVSMWPFSESSAGVSPAPQSTIDHEPSTIPVAGRISLRHAAQLAGLGRIGRNAMLITPEFGPRVQLGAILTDAELPASVMLEEDPCTACDLCIERCPAGALLVPNPPAVYEPVDREKCMTFRREHGGKSPLGYPDSCALCRALCPIGRMR